MSTHIDFSKYQGTGNDFVLIDAYQHDIPELSSKTIQEICHRQFGIGADGLIIIRKKDGYDFDMDFYNSDGYPGSMCGNGGRCAVSFAHDIGIIKESTSFWAPDGEHTAFYKSENNISIKMKDVLEIKQHQLGIFLDTGSPHLIIFEDSIEELDAYSKGKNIRYNAQYSEEGVNVNFVEINNNSISIITYERGVENLTFSCGTGTVAAALASNIKYNTNSPVKAITKGGILNVRFNKIAQNNFNEIWLEGPAIKTFSGVYKHT